ncbi:MAG: FprA family A-type flavoprotein [Clostridia bacterium]|nr:FprA family A-type flavoprotein [Clostridia bacterium]
MYNVTDDIIYVGVDDKEIDLFEGMYHVPNGMTYNSFVILDEKIAVTDSVDASFGEQWLKNIKEVLGGRKPDYLIIHHMEFDHSANIAKFIKEYPEVQLVGNAKTFTMIKEYFDIDIKNPVTVQEGYELVLGKHTLRFIMAAFVHWPEVMVSYDLTDKALFSADAFGTFGASDSKQPWQDEARRYYIGIVGKYGVQVQNLLKKVSSLDVQKILPLHGPVLDSNLSYYVGLYNIWSSYAPEKHAVMVAYASIYGHTAQAAKLLAEKLQSKGETVLLYDLARSDRAECVAQAFACDRLVLASVTYNAEIFPAMREFIDCLNERGYKNRTVGLIENGTWSPISAKLMRDRLAPCKNLTFTQVAVKVRAALNDESLAEIDNLVTELL